MITTVTLSPSVDKTVVLKEFNPDRVNRAESSRFDAGGKGVNVSLALSALGSETEAIGFSFDGGEFITKTLEHAGVGCEWVRCAGRMRTNLKIYDRAAKKTIELNEQNPEVTEKSIIKLTEVCRRHSQRSDILVLSGSVPLGVPEDIYQRLAFEAKKVRPGIKIVLDAEGSLLLNGLAVSPALIKPNVEELERTFGVTLKDTEDIIWLSKKIISDYGVGVVLVSMGGNGAVAVTRQEVCHCGAINIIPKSAQGAGDAMVAGACYALRKGLHVSDVLRCGTCAAAGAVELDGTAFCNRTRFEELLSAV